MEGNNKNRLSYVGANNLGEGSREDVLNTIAKRVTNLIEIQGGPNPEQRDARKSVVIQECRPEPGEKTRISVGSYSNIHFFVEKDNDSGSGRNLVLDDTLHDPVHIKLAENIAFQDIAILGNYLNYALYRVGAEEHTLKETQELFTVGRNDVLKYRAARKNPWSGEQYGLGGTLRNYIRNTLLGGVVLMNLNAYVDQDGMIRIADYLNTIRRARRLEHDKDRRNREARILPASKLFGDGE